MIYEEREREGERKIERWRWKEHNLEQCQDGNEENEKCAFQ